MIDRIKIGGGYSLAGRSVRDLGPDRGAGGENFRGRVSGGPIGGAMAAGGGFDQVAGRLARAMAGNGGFLRLCRLRSAAVGMASSEWCGERRGNPPFPPSSRQIAQLIRAASGPRLGPEGGHPPQPRRPLRRTLAHAIFPIFGRNRNHDRPGPQNLRSSDRVGAGECGSFMGKGRVGAGIFAPCNGLIAGIATLESGVAGVNQR